MARIAVGGFLHETNCFSLPPTDFASFTVHRDRPPLVRGQDVIAHLSDNSFALSVSWRQPANPTIAYRCCGQTSATVAR